MARFLVFDTQAVNDSINAKGEYCVPQSLWNSGWYGANGIGRAPITPWMSSTDQISINWLNFFSQSVQQGSYFAADEVWAAVRSLPVRLYSAEGVVPALSWEFCLTGVAAGIDIRWFQEYYNETAQGRIPGDARAAPLNLYFPWAREYTETVGANGAITHSAITRSVTLNSALLNGIRAADEQGASAYFPMTPFGMWARLAVWTPTNLGLIDGYYNDCATYPAPQRLRIYAIVGGHEQHPAMDATAKLGRLWADTNVAGPIIWDPTHPGNEDYITYTGAWPT